MWIVKIGADLQENLSCEAWWTFAGQGEVETKEGSLWKKKLYLGNSKNETLF